MINDASYWKRDLARNAKRLSKLSEPREWDERSFFNLEKDIFFAFYSIRKLVEADKLTQKTVDLKLKAICYPALGKGVTKLNNHRLDELFDLDKGLPTSLDLKFVCNQIVHSYIFMPFLDENDSLAGIAFTSDKKRNQQLCYLELDEIVSCLKTVASDDPTCIVKIYNNKKGDYEVTIS